MKIVFNSLRLHFRHSVEVLPLEHFNYYWGQIGAGKSSITRLIDFCLGADIDLTPALQTEFNQADLQLTLQGRQITLYRQREATKLVASWREGDDVIEILIPARRAEGVVLPGTSVEVLSDLLFHLAGLETPMVRKGKRTDESRLERLSFRDLFRFCYLDQDGMDSDFFRLDLNGDWARRQKSIDAVRFILGYHQDRVASLEAELQEIHEQKMAAKAAAEALKKVLVDAGLSDPLEIDTQIEHLQAERDRVRREAEAAKKQGAPKGHAVDILRTRGRNLAAELDALEEMSGAIQRRLGDTERHFNELKMLSVRFHRTSSAKALLGGVEFVECPRCSQELPVRPDTTCRVCGQPENELIDERAGNQVAAADLKGRLADLEETILGLRSQLRRVGRNLSNLQGEKSVIDYELAERLKAYDSAFLSRALEFQRQVSALDQQINSLLHYRKLLDKLDLEFEQADELQGQESKLRAKLNREREAAFRDRSNLERLEVLFLDCLVRAHFPGVKRSYFLRIDPKDFVPEISPSAEGDFAVTSFANMGSGGMKSVFKACYALALHRLANETGASLPTILIIDSAMKNVSERENVELFTSFFQLAYELAAGELSGTQFIVVDKELCEVPEGIEIDIQSRHMVPGSVSYSPLIPYYGVEKTISDSSMSDDVVDKPFSRNSEDD